MEKVLLTFLVGAIFGYIFFKCKVPGGFLVGAVVGSTILSVGFGMAHMPYIGKFMAQATAGAFIGVSFERDDLKKLKSIWKPTLTVLSSMMLINILAVILSVLGVLNPTTGALVHNAGSCFVVLLATLLYDRKFE